MRRVKNPHPATRQGSQGTDVVTMASTRSHLSKSNRLSAARTRAPRLLQGSPCSPPTQQATGNPEISGVPRKRILPLPSLGVSPGCPGATACHGSKQGRPGSGGEASGQRGKGVVI